MNKQILDLLTEMNKEMKSMKSDMYDLKSEMHNEMKSMKSDMYDLRSEMNKEMKSMKSDMYDLKSEMHNRFDTIERKLEGVGGQFELTNESRITDVDFITDKVNKLERELYILKNNKINN